MLGEGQEGPERSRRCLPESPRRTQWVRVLSGLRALGVPSRAPSLSYLAAVCRLSPLLRSVVESRAVHSSRPDMASRCEASRPSLKSFGSDSKFSAEDADWLSVGQGLPTWGESGGKSHAKRAVHEGVEEFQQRAILGQRTNTKPGVSCMFQSLPTQSDPGPPARLPSQKQSRWPFLPGWLVLAVRETHTRPPH